MNLMMNFPSLLAYQTANNQANAPAESSGGMPVWATLLIVAGMLFLPFIIGQLLANMLRLRDLGTKIGIALFVITMGAAPFVTQLIAGESPEGRAQVGDRSGRRDQHGVRRGSRGGSGTREDG